ncbi:hypothetical protein DS745_24080 [Anaerobacillus alkaliphilus]|uniref:Uncharacterized protein n=1 Tax=Anaerobacillus alkaliphilus TaxID=1548597 RepID=A0A4Q0VKM0_9BACI|nr:hypothetical protein [Anaerobacillus alkaliphilus]RXI95534.1 hypothetical protein DS745_24080 [Anaerobacillus alkaliphilus]
MKKFFIVILLLLSAGFLGNYAYNYFLSIASDKVIEHIVSDLLDEEMLDQILSDPNINEIVASFSENVGSEHALPFSTKEEGVKVVLSKFSIAEMTEIATQVQGGLSSSEQQKIASKLQERLTDEELEALMIIGIAEFKKEISTKTQ